MSSWAKSLSLAPEVKNLKIGDRVVVPFDIACGSCRYCSTSQFSLCDNSNPNALMAEELYGYSPAALYGYSHLYGGYAGGQAEYVRVPFADVGPVVVPESLTDEQVLFLTDIFPTGYQAAENCGIKPGDTVADLGLRPGRPVCDPECLHARRRAGDCDGPYPGAAGDGAGQKQSRRCQL